MWPHENAVYDALVRQVHQSPDRQLIVVHGACPSGADHFAHRWATLVQFKPWITVTAEPHPADWEHCRDTCRHTPRDRNGRNYCPASGPYRNQDMVDLGADVCLAFPLEGIPRHTRLRPPRASSRNTSHLRVHDSGPPMTASTPERHAAYRAGLCVDCRDGPYSAGRPRCDRCHDIHVNRKNEQDMGGEHVAT